MTQRRQRYAQSLGMKPPIGLPCALPGARNFAHDRYANWGIGAPPAIHTPAELLLVEAEEKREQRKTRMAGAALAIMNDPAAFPPETRLPLPGRSDLGGSCVPKREAWDA